MYGSLCPSYLCAEPPSMDVCELIFASLKCDVMIRGFRFYYSKKINTSQRRIKSIV